MFSTYENFVGPEHFACMSRLLGYQGTSMIVQQLLNIMNTAVSGVQAWCVCVCRYVAECVLVCERVWSTSLVLKEG